ncbi:MAG: molecular chaperone GrpE [Lentimonas sp.]|jgi:molecular chaperone GrpE
MTEEKIEDQVADPEENFGENLEHEINSEKQITLLEEENKSLNDKILRLAAELENTRKRSVEEVSKAHKYAVSKFASDIVLVLENFYLATENLPEDEIEKFPKVKNFTDAIVMTKKELSKTLENQGIKRIYPLGEKFDHNFHEAISQIITEDDNESGLVKQVIQAGYKIKERLIRPALVVVANKS